MDDKEVYIELSLEDAEVALDLLKSLSCTHNYEVTAYHCCEAGDVASIIEEKIKQLEKESS